jgi:redox-sensitive bicupin YhaK (pirin superfamily)
MTETLLDEAVVEDASLALRKIARRTHGNKNGPAIRLMSPSDFGQYLKPFVFLDYFDMKGPPFVGQLHPHSGIATLTYLIEGRMDLIDPDGEVVALPGGGVEWMQAGRGMWHGGSVGDSAQGRVCGYQLWIALPPSLELGPTVSMFQPTEHIITKGPVSILLGSYDGMESTLPSPSPMNYLAIKLRANEVWEYNPPIGHTVLWVSPIEGDIEANGSLLDQEELVAFEPSNKSVRFKALTDTQFVLGSAVPHHHDLVLGYYSVHTSKQALQDGEAHITALAERLVDEGRLSLNKF